MLFESRLVYQNSADVARSKSELASMSADLYRPTMEEGRYILDSRIDGAATLEQLPDEIKESMEKIIEGNLTAAELDPRKHLYKFAQALRRTKFFAAPTGGVGNRTTSNLSSKLDQFINKVDSTPGSITFNRTEQTFVNWLKKMYIAMAYYKQRHEAIAGDTRGQLESTKESLMEKGLKVPGRLIEVFAQRSKFEQIAILGAFVTGGAILWTRSPKEGEEGGLMSGVFKTLKTGGLIAAASFLAYKLADFSYEAYTGKKLGDTMERAHNTTDTRAYIEYFGVTDQDAEAIVANTNDTLLFNEKYSSKPFKQIWDEYNAVKSGPVSNQLIQAKTSGTPAENQEFNAKVFKGMEYIDKKLKSLRSEMTSTTDSIRKNSLQELFDGIEKRGWSASDTLIRLIAYEKSDTKAFHTHFGKFVEDWSNPDRDNSIIDYWDTLATRLESEPEQNAVRALWRDPNFMLAPQKIDGGNKIVTKLWTKEKFANNYSDLANMNASQNGNLMRTALLNNKPIEKADGSKYLAAEVPVDMEGDTAAAIIKRAHDELLSKYSINPTNVKYKFEVVVGARLAGGKYGLLVKAIPLDKYYNPI